MVPVRNRWRRLVVGPVVVLAACGRIAFDDARLGSPDAAPDQATTDAAPTGPFGAPLRILELASSANDDDPTLTADLLEIYFASLRPGGQGNADLWYATRGSVASVWSTPQPVAGLNTTNNDENPGVSPDGLQLWFSSNRGGNLDIWTATRPSRAQPWGTPVRVVELSTGVEDLGSEPHPSLVRLAFYRGAPRDLYEATRPSVAQQWAAAPIAELNTTSNERSPFLVGDTEIYFSSDRGGGAPDLYHATRAGPGAPFGAVEALASVGSTANDDDPWLSPDGRTLFFMSDRTGNEEIWMATR